MAKPAPKLQKPEPRSCGDIRYRVTRERPPGKEDGRWYWRAEKYRGGTSGDVWTGWATVAEADKTVAAIASGQAAPKGSAETVRDLLSFWLGHQEQRADLAPNTVRVRTQQCKALAADIGAVRLDRLDRLTLEGFRDRRRFLSLCVPDRPPTRTTRTALISRAIVRELSGKNIFRISAQPAPVGPSIG